MPRVTFRLRGDTQFGEGLRIVGSDRSLGCWNVDEAIEMQTTASSYPLWSVGPVDVSLPLEYKYVKCTNDGAVVWEEGELNRMLPAQAKAGGGQEKNLIVDDGVFDCLLPDSFKYFEGTSATCPGSLVPATPEAKGLKVVVFGSSVAAGHKASFFRGWAEMLGEGLRSRYGHGFVNASIEGMTAANASQVFAEKVLPLQPDVVILALGLDSEGLPVCPGHERAHVCHRFLAHLSELVSEVHRCGALPVVAGVYPDSRYNEEHVYWLEKVTEEMRQLDVPLLDWFEALAMGDGSGGWASGLSSFDDAHPNTEGHRKMFASVDLKIFEAAAVEKQQQDRIKAIRRQYDTKPVFAKGAFKVYADLTHDRRCELRICNDSDEVYMLNPDWKEFQSCLELARESRPGILKTGIYIAAEQQADSSKQVPTFVAVDGQGHLESRVEIPANCHIEFQHASSFFRPSADCRVLFYDGNLAVIQESGAFQLLNESNVEYNVHPMWRELRLATRKLPHGLYEDGSGRPFSIAIISAHGLSSRVKVPARSGLVLR
eukprot:TRINITY_DN7881_c0_g1_i1.p1 TRINITY_DN7881_c0_g1~~TRINITY_DN7881_c0_g1_i1.p1  ORF type:complete len:543 (+),score=90.19 TRINITY_DN7881_c0_g1_i1:115-1743(+)